MNSKHGRPPASSRMSRQSKLRDLVVSPIAICLCAAPALSCSNPGAKAETTTPTITDISQEVIAPGWIQPEKEILIKSHVSGVIEQVAVRAGQNVNQGDLLVKVRLIPDLAQVNFAEADKKRALISQQNAEHELQRKKELHAKELISDQEYQDALSDYELKNEELKFSAKGLQILQRGSSADVGESSNLIRATSRGTILDVPVKEGQFVTETSMFAEGTTIAAIADMQSLIFKGKVIESDVGQLREDLPLTLSIAAVPGRMIQSKIDYVAPKGIEEEGMVKFEIRAPITVAENIGIRAGYSANADIVINKRENVLAVKESDLRFDGDHPYVDVQGPDGTFARRDIGTGLSDGTMIEITKGLGEQDRIRVVHDGELPET